MCQWQRWGCQKHGGDDGEHGDEGGNSTGSDAGVSGGNRRGKGIVVRGRVMATGGHGGGADGGGRGRSLRSGGQ